uniref:Endonuclease/exonuclease/phosphatase domain-containing protein n=1 Tax=Amphiprion percula TaxID=161767 RepID=A0A3P8S8S8_AMPPE
MNKLNLVSYNVHGLNLSIKRKNTLNQLKKLQCSIVFYASYGKMRGVSILIGKGTPIKVEKDIKDNTELYIMIAGSIGDMTVSVLNVFAPSEEKETFFKQILKVITSEAKGMLLMGG